jgi:hypothetical protein
MRVQIRTDHNIEGSKALIDQQFQIQNEFTAFQPIILPLWSFNRRRNQGFQALKFLNLELLLIDRFRGVVEDALNRVTSQRSHYFR